MSRVTIFGTWNFFLGMFYFNQPMKKSSLFAYPSIQKQNVVCRCRRIAGAQNQDLPLCRTNIKKYIKW